MCAGGGLVLRNVLATGNCWPPCPLGDMGCGGAEGGVVVL